MSEELVNIYLAELPGTGILKIGSTRHHPTLRLLVFNGARNDAPKECIGRWNLVDHFKWRRGIENKIHTVLAPFRRFGREWYHDRPEVRAAFALLVAELA